MPFLWEPSDLLVNVPIEDVSGEPNLTDVDKAAEMYFRYNLNQDAPQFWMICVRVTRTSQPPEWKLYPFTSKDVPAGSHTVAPPTAVDFARGLVDQGFTVYVRHYTSMSLDWSATKATVTL
jgi:hypothetical protein